MRCCFDVSAYVSRFAMQLQSRHGTTSCACEKLHLAFAVMWNDFEHPRSAILAFTLGTGGHADMK